MAVNRQASPLHFANPARPNSLSAVGQDEAPKHLATSMRTRVLRLRIGYIWARGNRPVWVGASEYRG